MRREGGVPQPHPATAARQQSKMPVLLVVRAAVPGWHPAGHAVAVLPTLLLLLLLSDSLRSRLRVVLDPTCC